VFPVTRGLTAVAIQTREPVVVNDVASDPRYLAALAGTGSEMIVPVINDGIVVGTVDVESGEVGAFNERDAQRILGLVDVVRSALF
jgi:L-methionine (R)-S-oxide reductase